MNERLLTRVDELVDELCQLLDQIETEGNSLRSVRVINAVRNMAQGALERMAYPASFVELLREKDLEIQRLRGIVGERA